MKKITFLLMAAMLLLGAGAQAQILSAYSVETDNAPWVSIASTGTQLASVVGDGGRQSISMPFDFEFGDGVIAQGTTVYVRSDGYLILSNNPGSHDSYGYYSGGAPVIVPFLLVDGQMPSGNSACYWQLETDSYGGQVLAVEFQHVQHWNGSNDNFNYQLRIYESGNVSVHYGHMENHYADSSFNFMMGAASGSANDHVVLSGTWDSPTVAAPSSIGSSASNVLHLLTGMPDSGLVITYVRPEPACGKPRNIRVENLGPTSGVLTWTGNGVPGCTYELYFDSTWFTYLYPGNRPLLSTNDTVYYLDSLQPGHHYYIFIMSDCGADVSAWQSMDFVTPCQAMGRSDLPYTENFDSYTNYTTYSDLFDPGCWRRSTSGAAVNVYSGQRCLRMSNVVAALPPVDTLGGLEVSFSAYCQSGTMEFGILENPGDYASFLPLSDIAVTPGAWTNLSLRTGGYNGDGKSVAFRVNGIWHVDNIDVHEAVGCPAVDTVMADSFVDTATTAIVTWVDVNHTGSYRVVCRPLGSAVGDTVYASASPTVLTGLMPDVEYLVQVYALCGSEASTAAGATFHTPCLPMTAPFSEGFESEGLSFCWKARSLRLQSASPFPDWVPETSQTEASEGSYSLRMASRRTSMVGREASWVVLPATTDASNRLMVDFDYKVPSGYEYVELVVGVTTSVEDTSGFSRVATLRPVDGNWHRYSVDFAFSDVVDGRIALLQDNHTNHSYASASVYDYGYLDSVVVSPFTACMRPVSLRVGMVSDAEATVEWVDINGAGTYEVSCGGQTVTVAGDTTYTFTGLSPETVYNVSVRTVCTDGFTDAVATSFTTACTGIGSLPWSEDFDSWTDDGFDPCWTRIHAGTTYSSAVVQEGRLRMLADTWQGVAERTLVALPLVAMPYNGLAIAFNVMGMNSTMSNTVLELGVVTNGADSTTFVAFDTVPFGSEWGYYERALGGIGSGRLALRLTSLSSWHQVYLDDFSLFYATSCARPDSLLLDSASLGILRVRIADDDSSGRYRLWWGVGERSDSADVAGYAYTITGLTHSTTYDVWAASICPTDSTLSTMLSVRMATACGVITHDELPWSEDYDDGLGICQSFVDYCYPNNSGDRTNRTSGRGYSGALVPNVGYNNQPFFYVMPQVDSLVGVALDFWARGEATVQVGVMSDPADTLTFTAMQSITLPSLEDWHEYYVSLGSSSDTNIYVAMRFGNGGGGFHAPVVLDDVRLVRDLSCMAPDSVSVAAVTDSSALLVVHDPRGVGHYRLYTLSDSIDFMGDSVEVNGLAMATDYVFEVASVCEEGLATFSVAVGFTTECGAIELPYTEEFEGCPTNRMPRCWEVKGMPTYTPSVRNATTVVNGHQALIGSIGTSDSVLTFTSPMLHVVDTDAYVGFMLAVRQSYSDSSYHSHYLPMRVRVVYQDDTTGVETLLLDDSIASSASTQGFDWHSFDFATYLTPAGTGRLYFSFFRDTLATSATFGLDSVAVETLYHEPPCRPVADLHVDSVTLGTVMVGWTPQGPATEWEVRISSHYGDTLLVANSPGAMVSGLEQGTEYGMVVRPMCSDGQLLWSDTLRFTTLECPPVEDVTVVGVGTHSVDVEWMAPTAGPWRLEYGPKDFGQGMGAEMIVDAQAPGRVSTRIEGLNANTIYDLYVMTLCDEAKKSVWSDVVRFTTEVDGIGEVAETGRLLLVPNPASGSVELRGVEAGARVTVRDAAGRGVMSLKMESAVLDISSLEAGIYYVIVTTDHVSTTFKLVVF
ncbi:MAG: T9SS type A sorting domain-containing protein [Bacteroidales bacterium]|nr:T9SS type A sorting domain-containing protein [Bacteroidales bacterium]